MKKTIVHVNQHNVKANRKKTGLDKPVLTIKTYNTNTYGHGAALVDREGKEVGRFVYRPDQPLSCGAHVWFETRDLTIQPLTRPEVSDSLEDTNDATR